MLGSAPGTVTWLPAAGRVLRQGQPLFSVDGRPVVLLYGSTPAYRNLAVGVAGVLVVPVTALLARGGGGYAVEVVRADGPHRLLPVTVGLFDDADGLVQITGAGLKAGQSVVVPAG